MGSDYFAFMKYTARGVVKLSSARSTLKHLFIIHW
jgi:hypothetical protein